METIADLIAHRATEASRARRVAHALDILAASWRDIVPGRAESERAVEVFVRVDTPADVRAAARSVVPSSPVTVREFADSTHTVTTIPFGEGSNPDSDVLALEVALVLHVYAVDAFTPAEGAL